MLLADVSADYLVAQIDAGADAVQIFDSWAGVLGEREFEAFAVKPVARMIASIKTRRPNAKIIKFLPKAPAIAEDLSPEDEGRCDRP